MYKKIMVPLDGSDLAECVLPHVETAVKGCNAPKVIFVRVVEPTNLPIGTLSDGGAVFNDKDAERIRKETDTQNKSEAKAYLDRLVSRLKYEGTSLRTEVIVGKAAESLAEYVQKNGVDLVVIATHGRSSVSRWVWGSTADRILRSVCAPVLMVRAPGCVPGI